MSLLNRSLVKSRIFRIMCFDYKGYPYSIKDVRTKGGERGLFVLSDDVCQGLPNADADVTAKGQNLRTRGVQKL